MLRLVHSPPPPPPPRLGYLVHQDTADCQGKNVIGKECAGVQMSGSEKSALNHDFCNLNVNDRGSCWESCLLFM